MEAELHEAWGEELSSAMVSKETCCGEMILQYSTMARPLHPPSYYFGIETHHPAIVAIERDEPASRNKDRCSHEGAQQNLDDSFVMGL